MICGHYRFLALPEDCPHFRVHPHDHCLLKGLYPSLLEIGACDTFYHNNPCLDCKWHAHNKRSSSRARLRRNLHNGVTEAIQAIQAIHGARLGHFSVGRRYHDLPWHVRFSETISVEDRTFPAVTYWPPVETVIDGSGPTQNRWLDISDEAERFAAEALKVLRQSRFRKTAYLLYRARAKATMLMYHHTLAKQAYFAIEKRLTSVTSVRAEIEEMLRASVREYKDGQPQGAVATDTGHKTTVSLIDKNASNCGKDPIENSVHGDAQNPVQLPGEDVTTNAADDLRALPLHKPRMSPLRERLPLFENKTGSEAAALLLKAWLGMEHLPASNFSNGNTTLAGAMEDSWRTFLLKYEIEDEGKLKKRKKGAKEKKGKRAKKQKKGEKIENEEDAEKEDK